MYNKTIIENNKLLNINKSNYYIHMYIEYIKRMKNNFNPVVMSLY